jgi:thiol-disulfide isomerase/thioredoxin
MANIIDVLRKYIRPYYYYIIAIVVFIVFLLVGIYWYQRQKSQTQNRFKDVANQNRRNHETPIYFFHADWCPHCKRAQPEWDAFCAQYDRKEINGYLIQCVDVDCTADPPSSDVKALMQSFNVSSFPTVKLMRDEKTIDFDSKITRTSLGAFVNTMLN